MRNLAAIAIVAIPFSQLLAGCERPDRSAALTASLDEANQKIASLQAELTNVQTRLNTLESKSIQPASQPPTPPVRPRVNAQAVRKVIGVCVTRVHAIEPQQEYERKFYLDFDAYFNEASGRVENNVLVNGQMPALYAFNRCMAENGFALK